ncbi:hypothetical protein KY285_004941 [Solanum tuberosum]|nr:hypothetical protein KY285_004941 [Solanum tuberosum]
MTFVSCSYNSVDAFGLHQQDGDAFALTKFSSLHWSFSYSEPVALVKVGDVSGEPHLRIPITGVRSRLRFASESLEPKESGELCSCKLFFVLAASYLRPQVRQIDNR